MLKFRRDLHYFNIPLVDKFSKKMMTHVMCFEFEFVMGFCASCTAPWLSSKTGKHGMTLLGNMKRLTFLKNNYSFTASPRAAHSASEVERVTHF